MLMQGCAVRPLPESSVAGHDLASRSLRHGSRARGVWEGHGRGGSGVVISSQSGHRLPALTVEQNKALATTPTGDLLSLPFLQLDRVRDSRHAYQLSKRGKSLRVMAEAGALGPARRADQHDQSGDRHDPLAKAVACMEHVADERYGG
jgi:hypothetical protein